MRGGNALQHQQMYLLFQNKPFDKTLASKKTARQTVVPAKAKTISAKSSTHAFGFSSDDSENEGIGIKFARILLINNTAISFSAPDLQFDNIK